jgi:hypothetical protein
MNIESLIDFNKYTLALAAAAFAYALEKLSSGTSNHVATIATLSILAISTLAGILLFSVATSASHYVASGSADIPTLHLNAIRWLGTFHSVLLTIGIVLLGGLLLAQLLAPPEPAKCKGLTITLGMN